MTSPSDGQRRAAWLLQRQGGLCFLGITQACRDAGLALSPIQLGKRRGAEKAGPRGWTWEHVIPASLALHLMGDHVPVHLKLLACRPCNEAKGGSLPRDEHVALAMQLSREWFEGDGRTRIALEQISDLELLVAAYRRHRANPKRLKTWPLPQQPAKARIPMVEPCADPEVPASIEEALAQGGIGQDEAMKPARRLAADLRAKAQRARAHGDEARAAELFAEAWGVIDRARASFIPKPPGA